MSRKMTLNSKPLVWEDGSPVSAGQLEVGREYNFSIEPDQYVMIDVLPTRKGPLSINDLDAKSVPNRLRAAADLYEQRNAVYGSDYYEHGQLMMALFPNGLALRTDQDFARYNLFKMVVAKAARYAKNFLRAGHADSLDDISVYAQMLRELDDKITAENAARGEGDAQTK